MSKEVRCDTTPDGLYERYRMRLSRASSPDKAVNPAASWLSSPSDLHRGAGQAQRYAHVVLSCQPRLRFGPASVLEMAELLTARDIKVKESLLAAP